MRRNKAGSLFLVAILALGGIGISYAGWTDTIFVSGTVQTGYVGFEVTEYSGTWVWKQISTHLKFEHNGPVAATDLNNDGKLNDDPVAYANGWYSNLDYKLVAYSYAHNEMANEKVKFEFVNLFPCVNFNADFKFTIGTIPVILTATDMDWTNEKINNVATPWINGISGHSAPTKDVTITYVDATGAVIQVYPGTAPIQLHPGITYTWNLRIHIPQDNAYMNAYAEGSCELDIIQWSDTCDGTTPDKSPEIASDTTMFVCRFTNHPWQYETGRYCYFKNTLSGLWPQGTENNDNILYNVWDGDWVAWCVDNTEPGSTVNLNTNYNAHMFNSYNIPDVLPNGVLKSDHTDPNNAADPYKWMNDPDWPYVNWIINNKPATHSWEDVQQAIWYFVDGGAVPTDPQAVALKDAALANCNPMTYHPQSGENVAVIIWINPDVPYPGQTSGTQGHHQVTIIEVDP